MIVSEAEELTDLGFLRKKKRKTAKVAPPPPTVDYGFKAPKSGGKLKPSDVIKASSDEIPATLAPTSTGGSFIQENLHLIVGGLVAVSGVGVLLYLKRAGKL